jgi:hypothetical protein
MNQFPDVESNDSIAIEVVDSGGKKKYTFSHVLTEACEYLFKFNNIMFFTVVTVVVFICKDG